MPPVARVNGWAKGGKEVVGSCAAPSKATQQATARPLLEAKLFVRTTTEFQFRTSPDIAAKNEKGVYAKVGEKFGVKRQQNGWCQLDNELWLPIQVGKDLLLIEGVEHDWYQVLVSPGVSYRASRRVEDKYGNGDMFAKKDQVIAVRRVEGAWCYLANGLFLPLSIKGTWLLKKLIAPVTTPAAPAAPVVEAKPTQEAEPANSEATGKAPSLPSPAATPTHKEAVKEATKGNVPDGLARTIKVSGCSRTNLNGVYELEPNKLHQGRNIWLQKSKSGEKTKLIRWQNTVKEWVIDDELIDSTSVYACPSRSVEDARDPTEVADGWAVYKSNTKEFVLESAMKVLAVSKDELVELKPPVAAAIPALPTSSAPASGPSSAPTAQAPAGKREVPWYLKCNAPTAKSGDKQEEVDDTVYDTLLSSSAPTASKVHTNNVSPTDSSDDENATPAAEAEKGSAASDTNKSQPKDPQFHKKMLEYLRDQEKKKEEDQAPPKPEEPRPKPTPQSLLDLPSAPYQPPPIAKGNVANVPLNVPPVVPNASAARWTPPVVPHASLFSSDGSMPGTRPFGVNGYGRAIGPMAPVIPHAQRGRRPKRGSRMNNSRRGRGNNRRGRGRGMRFNGGGRGGRGGRLKFMPNGGGNNGMNGLMVANPGFKPSNMPALPFAQRPVRQPLVPAEPLGLVVFDNQLAQAKGVLGHPELVCVSVHTTGRLRDKFLPRTDVRFMRPQQKAKLANKTETKASTRKLDVAAKEFKPTG